MLSSEARYQQIATEIQQQLEQGDYAVSDRLPSIAALAETFGVSEVTIKRALAVLTDHGLLFTSRGVRATVVALPNSNSRERDLPSRVSRVEEQLRDLATRTERLEHAHQSTQESRTEP